MTKIKSAIAKAHGRTKGGYLHVSNDSGDLLHSHNTEVNPNFFWVHLNLFQRKQDQMECAGCFRFWGVNL